MSDFNQPAYPTTPEHHGYPSGMEEAHMYSGSGLSKLQRVASEQLAALISAYHVNDDMSLQISESDVVRDDAGNYQRLGKSFAYYCSPAASRERFRLVTSPETLIARMAVKYAKELLEITE